MESGYRSYIKKVLFGFGLCFASALFCAEIQQDPFNRFMEAIRKEDVDQFIRLHPHVKDINGTDWRGTTPLLCSIFEQAYNCFLLLLKDRYIDVNREGKIGHPLLLASRLGLKKFVKVLLDAEGIEVNHQDAAGYTALHLAIDSQKYPIIVLLAQKVQIINIQNNQGNTALMHALLMNHISDDEKNDIIDCLLRCGANPFVVNKEGLSPYSVASREIQDQIDSTGLEPLIVAIDSGDTKLAVALIPDVNINGLDKMGLTPLMEAVLAKNSDVVDALLADRRLDINTADTQGRSALIYAAWDGNLDYVRQIADLRPDVDFNQVDNDGYPPLMRAVKNGNRDIIEFLLLRGANPLQRNYDNLHSLYLASEEIQTFMLAVLDNIRQQQKKERAIRKRNREEWWIGTLRTFSKRIRDFWGPEVSPSRDSREFKYYGD